MGAQSSGIPSGAPPARSFSFGRLATGVLLYNASGGVLYAILPLFEFQQGGGALLATLIVGAPLLASTLGTFGWGSLSDRWGRRRELLALGVLAQSGIFVLYPLLSPAALVVARIVQAFLGASAALATTQATEDPGRSAGSGLGGLSFWGSLGSVLGILAGFPFLGGGSFTARSPTALLLFVMLALLSAASVLFLVSTGEIPRRRSATALRNLLSFRDGRTILWFCVATAIVGAGNFIVYTLFPLWVDWAITPQHPFGVGWNSTQQLAVLSIGASLGGVVVSPWTGRVVEGRSGRRGLYFVAPLVYALLWVALAFVVSYPVVLFIWSIPVYVILSIPILREISGRTLPEERGRAVGLWSAAFSMGGLGGTLLAGWAWSGGPSFRPLFVLAAVIDLVGFAALVLIPTRGQTSSPANKARSAPESG